jgi:hypothetical protein
VFEPESDWFNDPFPTVTPGQGIVLAGSEDPVETAFRALIDGQDMVLVFEVTYEAESQIGINVARYDIVNYESLEAVFAWAPDAPENDEWLVYDNQDDAYGQFPVDHEGGATHKFAVKFTTSGIALATDGTSLYSGPGFTPASPFTHLGFQFTTLYGDLVVSNMRILTGADATAADLSLLSA